MKKDNVFAVKMFIILMIAVTVSSLITGLAVAESVKEKTEKEIIESAYLGGINESNKTYYIVYGEDINCYSYEGEINYIN